MNINMQDLISDLNSISKFAFPNSLVEPLGTMREYIDMEMHKWLLVKHEQPTFLLNLSFQQQNLRQKLKWEQKFNSRQKLNKLKKMIRKLKKR